MSLAKKVYVIAEGGVNHNGSLERAYEMVDAAISCGVDAIKFQTFKAEKLVSRFAPKAEYQIQTTGSQESQLEMIRKLEMSIDHQTQLIGHCRKRGIQFLSSPFDLESIDVVAHQYDLPRLKIPSGELTNGPFLMKVAQTGKPVILSTGMATLGEIEVALGVFAYVYLGLKVPPSLEAFHQAFIHPDAHAELLRQVTLLHCTTEYPAPFEDVNLRAMDTMAAAFGLPIGFSDHTEGIAIPIAAVARGACMIEKHFTLDRNLPGPDHKASLDPGQFKAMVEGIRAVEQSIGSPLKTPARSEVKNIVIARKSLVLNHAVSEGTELTSDNLTMKRPGGGISPMLYWNWLGKRVRRDFSEDEALTE